MAATTFRVDVVEAIRVVLEAQKTATPTQLRKVYTSQPGSVIETPCAYIGDRTESITYTAQTRTREMTGLTVVLADTLIDASETDDRMDALVDLLVARFTDANAAVPGGGGLLQMTSVTDTLLTLSGPKGDVVYRAAVLGFGNPDNPTFTMEGITA